MNNKSKNQEIMEFGGFGPSHNKIEKLLNQNYQNNSSELLNLLFKYIYIYTYFHKNEPTHNKKSHKLLVPFPPIGLPLEPHWSLII